ncbi:MAG: VWA domain-containing protein [Planctomycetes bacterium]|nr:VWA domain-containing protein [Planctomycetota bacterium]
MTVKDGNGPVGLHSVDSPKSPTNEVYELFKANPTLSIRDGRVVANDGTPVTDYSSVDLSVQDKKLAKTLALVNALRAQQQGKNLNYKLTGGRVGGVAVGGGANVGLRTKPNSSESYRILTGDEARWNISGGLLLTGDSSREAYARIVDNKFMRVGEQPLSTFSIDVDTASYANMRRFINGGSLPPPDAVRIEELLNYFNYDYAGPTETDEHPFATHVEVAVCPWNSKHRLARIGIKGREIESDMRPATNLVFLLDVSGSMNQPNKLPLVKRSMQLLLNNLTVDDRVAIVVYAGASGLVLPSTYCTDKQVILSAIERLHAGGSTNGGAGIELAYNTAAQSFIEGGVNRVILCTDGDFNVGISSDGDLVRLIEEKRKSHIFLSVLGFGTGNWQDSKMEQLSNAGNGNFAYIDSLREANKVLVEEMGGTLVTIAKDVKIQIEFNPAVVSSYRLIGYENRVLAAQDFNDDTKDAGEIGAGHTVTALYEIVLVGDEEELTIADTPPVDDLKYQEKVKPNEAAKTTGELMTVKLRYKEPEGDVSKLLEYPIMDEVIELADASADFKFASAVASFGMLLRGSPHKGNATFESVLYLARAGLSNSSNMGQAHRFLEDFIHYTLIAKPELAAANIRALLDSDLNDSEIASLTNGNPDLRDRLTRAIVMAAKLEGLAEPTQELTKRIENSRGVVVPVNLVPPPAKAKTNYREEFIELVNKAATMMPKQ